MFETTVEAGVCRARRPGARWLVTGPGGGYRDADAAYNVTVPEGFDRTDLAAYAAARRARAGFDADGPTLLTGVEMRHARGARLGPVAAVVTAGVSNPARLPLDPDDGGSPPDGARRLGTVNCLVGTDRSLSDGALATLLGVVVETKAAVLQSTVGAPGTSTDAVAVGCDPRGDRAAFAGSATPVGDAARAAVREATRAALGARYPDGPPVPADAEHPVSTDRRATGFDPTDDFKWD
ncbi:MAG: adenosylcobinamide amidohydrolase [Halobacteriaceae archaeon]